MYVCQLLRFKVVVSKLTTSIDDRQYIPEWSKLNDFTCSVVGNGHLVEPDRRLVSLKTINIKIRMFLKLGANSTVHYAAASADLSFHVSIQL